MITADARELPARLWRPASPRRIAASRPHGPAAVRRRRVKAVLHWAPVFVHVARVARWSAAPITSQRRVTVPTWSRGRSHRGRRPPLPREPAFLAALRRGEPTLGEDGRLARGEEERRAAVPADNALVAMIFHKSFPASEHSEAALEGGLTVTRAKGRSRRAGAPRQKRRRDRIDFAPPQDTIRALRAGV